MASLRIIPDKDFDRLVIRSHANSRNISMRVKEDGIHITVPPRTKTQDILDAVEKYREKMKESYVSHKPEIIDYGYAIDTECFKLRVRPGYKHFYNYKNENDVMMVYCPGGAELTEEATQKQVKLAIVRAMKKRAEEFFPPLLAEHAAMHGMKYNKIKITSSRSRWGSCSSRGTICLSCYLMLVPPHLMDYVMLHELAHTKEMNHGPEFWALLDRMTGDMALALRAELRKFRPIF